MYDGHGNCGMNNPNCGSEVKGCAMYGEPDPNDFNIDMTEIMCEELHVKTQLAPSASQMIQSIVDYIECEAGMNRGLLKDNELYKHLCAVVEICGDE